ncbi:MAG: hypothetical protein A2Z95_00080 [Gallionellales bacterium GWA2_60_18]|nr:MAG: hypothetical protein A2Z95_00080 [Gallionellales bacterium GWA2_60_18]
MANLPITANNAPPANGAANILPSNNTADAQAGDAQAGGPFAKLLSLQMDAANLLAPDNARATAGLADAATLDAATIAATDPTLKEGSETANITDIANAPAEALAALLLQIPAQKVTGGEQGTEHAAATAIAHRNAPGNRPGTDAWPGLNHFRTSGDTPTMTDVSKLAGESGIALDAQEMDSAVPPLSFSARIPTSAETSGRHMDLAASQLQTAPGATQPGASAVTAMAPATLAGMLPTGVSAEAPQAMTVSTPLGSDRWANDFTQKITWMGTQQNQVAELHLNPPDLGPLNVVLKVSDNQATALFTSPHSAVRDAVENALPKLREMLADNGIMLGNATVSDQSLHDRGSERFANREPGMTTERAMPEIGGVTQEAPVSRHIGMVDTFA